MSAKKAIREFCLSCTLNSYTEVRECPSEDCAIWNFREGLTIKGESKQKAIRKKCEDCIQTNRTRMCEDKKCPLYPYREGHRPVEEGHVKKVISPEHLKKLSENRPKKRKFIGKH